MENKDIIKRLDNLESQNVKLEHKNNLLADKYFDLEVKFKKINHNYDPEKYHPCMDDICKTNNTTLQNIYHMIKEIEFYNCSLYNKLIDILKSDPDKKTYGIDFLIEIQKKLFPLMHEL